MRGPPRARRHCHCSSCPVPPAVPLVLPQRQRDNWPPGPSAPYPTFTRLPRNALAVYNRPIKSPRLRPTRQFAVGMGIPFGRSQPLRPPAEAPGLLPKYLPGSAEVNSTQNCGARYVCHCSGHCIRSIRIETSANTSHRVSLLAETGPESSPSSPPCSRPRLCWSPRNNLR
ncbi:hypothetical protein BS50DRAFT_279735 [Corynespora cassiicola Philippines]|uniref:Uncharacterized protein n=1 Tax=Corynespora cassiicola Philippines TaxID=1448308 RepID=A0A2T2P0S7_CORCC|nr:hypothetical protein BS50DRAFT_279735 [Corynespora cassiicola Philippines]